MQREGAVVSADHPAGLLDLWLIAWKGKWIILSVAFLAAIGSIGYALLATEWYRAEVLLAPADSRSGPALGGQLGGLAALAGVSIRDGDGAEAVAVLKSRELAREFIEEFDLLQVFFADSWDEPGGRWKMANPSDWPDVRDAIEFFHEKVLSVNENRQTRMVTLGIEWKSPELAAEWARILVRRLNERLRARALEEAETNVRFLEDELARTSIVTLQQTIGRLLESELQKLMLARGSDEFAFRVIDPANVPKKRERPKRTLLVIVGTLVGGLLGTLVVFVINAARLTRDPGSVRS
jgi:uncharacterized protein involved in exopolysaccharide biosynthesis